MHKLHINLLKKLYKILAKFFFNATQKNLFLIILPVAAVACRNELGLTADSASSPTFNPPPGGKAQGPNPQKLEALYAVSTSIAPAPIRADPDLFARRLLRQNRPEGPLIARQIGKVEAYRLLLGGASEDFRTAPQESFDATSLLAFQKVSETICRALVAPTSWEHPGWQSILPYPADQVKGNLKFLAQRLIGIPSTRISAEMLADLLKLVEQSKQNNKVTNESYVFACVALNSDAEAIFL